VPPDSSLGMSHAASTVDRVGERLTDKERQDLLAFGAFIVVGIATVLVVIVAQNDWNPNRWAAVAAIATSVQTTAVVGALIFAKRQVDQTNRLARRHRRLEVLDRVEALAYSTVEPGVRALQDAFRSIKVDVEMWTGDEGEDADRIARMREVLTAHFGVDRDRFNAARTLLDDSVRRLRRVVDWLGRDHLALQQAVLILSISVPDRVWEDAVVLVRLDHLTHSADRLDTAWQRVHSALSDVIELHANWDRD
jgi:hypothetical protein